MSVRHLRLIKMLACALDPCYIDGSLGDVKWPADTFTSKMANGAGQPERASESNAVPVGLSMTSYIVWSTGILSSRQLRTRRPRPPRAGISISRKTSDISGDAYLADEWESWFVGGKGD